MMKLVQNLAARGSVLTGLFIALCLFLLTACAGNVTPAPFQAQAPASLAPTLTPAATPAQAVTAAPGKAKNEPALPQQPDEMAGFQRLSYYGTEYFVHIPPTIVQEKSPYQLVIAVHGMNNDGRTFGQPLIEYADEYNLVLVAPTLKYDTNLTDPARIAANDGLLLPQLNHLIQSLPETLGHTVSPRILLFGFSRGGQIVHRYATFYPETVLGVAAMSAGSYTLPAPRFKRSDQANSADLRFPFGTADLAQYAGHSLNLDALRKVNFWLGVGGADNAVKDVPAAWDPYLGNNRVERAAHYYQALQAAGIQASFTVFPGVGHAVCTEMKQQAFAFFNKLLL